MKRGAITPTQVMYAIISVLIIVMLIQVGIKTRSEGAEGIDELVSYLDEGAFEPYVADMSDEENTVLNSMKALVTALNSLAKREYLNDFGDNLIEEEPPFAKYRVYWSGRLELEERDGAVCGIPTFWLPYPDRLSNNCNSFRDWMFLRTFPGDEPDEVVAVGQPAQRENWVHADYLYGSCPTEGTMATVGGYCNEADTSSTDYRNGQIRPDITTDLAAVRDILPLMHIKIETLDEGGSIVCTATTAPSGLKEDFIDVSQKDFITWGAVSNWAGQCGADNNGNGIKGQYCDDDYGKSWRDARGINQDVVLTQEQINRYFPDGKIQAKEDNGEGCLDSPTWLECPGIKVYYCGKIGCGSQGCSESTDYYIGQPGDDIFHSKAGAKFLVDIDPKYTGHPPVDSSLTGYTSEYRHFEYDNSVDDDRNRIKVRSSSWDVLMDTFRGDLSYAQQYDLDAILALPFGGPIGTGIILSNREQKDPIVFCQNGEKFGETTAKCDPEQGVCGVCDFELPDSPAADYESNLLTIAGYGDPRWVIYYEAFPPGEEEAWHMEPLTLGLGSIVLVNTAGLFIDVAGHLQVAKKIMGMLEKIPILGQASKFIKSGGKVISFLGRKTDDLVRRGGDRILEILKLSAKGAEHADIAVKAFDDAGIILKYVDPEDLKSVGVNLEGSAELVAASYDLDDILFRLDQIAKVPTARDVALQELPYAIRNRGAKFATAYLVGLALAKDDSTNEKFYPVGVNAIGVRKPFQMTMVSGDENIPELDEKVNNYYIQLVKDKVKGGAASQLLHDQNNQRFFLASPCKANLQIVESECGCWDINEEVETVELSPGNPVQVLDMFVEDSATDMAARHRNSVKVCRDVSAGLEELNPFSTPVLHTDCIMVNPVIKQDTFCYSGSHTIEDIAKGGVLVAQFGLGIGNEILWDAVAAGTIWSGVGPAAALTLKYALNIGIDVLGTAAYNGLEKETKWPNH